jgi:hypothetical protein
MPQIFTGKLLIPGEQLQPYFEALAAAEAAREPFRRHPEALNEAFGAALATTYTRPTVLRHTGVVRLFIDFLCDDTDVERLEEVTRGMVTSGVRRWATRKVWGGPEGDELRVGLRRFFRFLAADKGIRAPKALEALA